MPSEQQPAGEASAAAGDVRATISLPRRGAMETEMLELLSFSAIC